MRTSQRAQGREWEYLSAGTIADDDKLPSYIRHGHKTSKLRGAATMMGRLGKDVGVRRR